MDLEGLKPRIGVDLGRRYPAEEGWPGRRTTMCGSSTSRWTARPTPSGSFLGDRGGALRAACAASEIELGLHTLSAISLRAGVHRRVLGTAPRNRRRRLRRLLHERLRHARTT